MPEDHQAADPVQAFEDLRAEVSVLRKAIEALPDALDRNRAKQLGIDSGSTLGRVIQAPSIKSAIGQIMRGRDRGVSL